MKYRYRYKDKKNREYLDGLTDGNFSRVFNEQVAGPMKSGAQKIDVVCDQLAPFEFYRDEVEEVHEFDPIGWNPWPEVTPPEEGAYYMLELPSDHMKLAAIWEGRGWIADDPGGGGYVVVNTGSEKGARFRTWGDAPALSKKLLQEVVTALKSHPDAYDLGYLIDDVSEAADEMPDEEAAK